MKLRIYRQGQATIEAEVDAVTMPGAAGQITPMSGHDILLTPLKEGALFFRPIEKGGAGERRDYTMGSGFMEVLRDCVSVFTTRAEPSK
ncbi:MAG: hypothetical protein WC956_09850 [bacterium]